MKKTEENVNAQYVQEDKGNFGWAVLGFFFPLIGLILYLVWSTTRKGDAKKAGIGALVGFLSKILIVPIVMIFAGSFFYFSIWPEIQNDIVETTCQTYGEEYHAYQKEDETWVCKNEETGEILEIDEETGEAKSTGKAKSYLYGGNWDGEYAVLIDEKIDNFTDLDFNTSTKNAGDSKLSIKNGRITYTYFDDMDEGEKTVEIPNVNNAVSARLSCDCGGCNLIYYLNSDNQVYSVELDPEYLANGSDLDKKLLATDIKGIDTVSYLGSTTCGGVELVLKNNNNEILIVNELDSGEIEYLTKEYRQIKWLNSNYEYAIYGVNNTNVLNRMLKDKNGKNIVCKNLFTDFAEGTEPNTYILTTDDYLYFFGSDEIDNRTGKLVSESKVSNFKESDGKVVIEFADSKTIDFKGEKDY